MLNRILMVGVLAVCTAWGQELERGVALLKAGQFAEAAVVLQAVVDREPRNLKALRPLAAATFMSGAATRDSLDKNRRLGEAERVLKRVIEIDAADEDAYYTLGVIAWTKVYPELRMARAQLGMKPEDSGPLTEFSVRQEMRARFGTVIEEGVENLGKALQINGGNGDAMAYTNLLLRSQADIRDTAEQAAEDLRTADRWAALAMRAKSETPRVEHFYAVTPPPPPPPPPGTSPVPTAIRVGGNVAAANVEKRVEPVYPPLALQARIQGTVRFNVTIGKDGRVTNLTLISGHPLLVAAAQSALQQWVYKPTLLNGQPVAVMTTVELNFGLPN